MHICNGPVRIFIQADIHSGGRPSSGGVFHLQGCFVDGKTLEDALTDIQDVAAVWITSQEERGWPMLARLYSCGGLPIETLLPVEA